MKLGTVIMHSSILHHKTIQNFLSFAILMIFLFYLPLLAYACMSCLDSERIRWMLAPGMSTQLEIESWVARMVHHVGYNLMRWVDSKLDG